MALSSIHIQAVKGGSERHNNREQKLNYVREDLSHLNSKTQVCKIGDRLAELKTLCKERTGRSLQEKAKPIREGVLLTQEHHTAQDLKELGDKLQERFGIQTIQTYCHKDEGHYDKVSREWKPNYHGHMVFDWMNHDTGKSYKLNAENLVEMQTIVAEHLGLERGQKSTKLHLGAVEYKVMKEQESLQQLLDVKQALPEALKIVSKAESLGADIDTLEKKKKGLTEYNLLAEGNLEYVENKTAKATEQLKELEQKIEKQQSQGMSR